MSTFDHPSLISNISQSLTSLRQGQSQAMQGFSQLAQGAMATASITEKHKELMAVAIAITQRCSGCIGFHVKALHRLGCTREELDEMLTVCVYMGGGPALMYTAEAIAAWNAFAPALA